jgi:arginyl-tRNA synthetase
MNLLAELRARLDAALTGMVDDRAEMVDLLRVSQDSKFGDYQANCAMPLGKRLGKPPREVAAEIEAKLKVDDLCEPPEIAGPGFINLRLKNDWLAEALARAERDERLGVTPVAETKTFVVDFSAPNVAKPMHVGHIRSTVIGAALVGTLRFLGHRVISDNHIGDWGTQFGMIIYGYKHFLDPAAYEQSPVDELARLYRLVNQLVDYHNSRQRLPQLEKTVADQQAALERLLAVAADAPKNELKEAQKQRRQLENKLAESRSALSEVEQKIAAIEADSRLKLLAERHPQIAHAVLAETAKLHAGDIENRRLWEAFLPPCREALEAIYRRLHVSFDRTLGESFYHDRLAGVVDSLKAKGIARESEGAICVFLPGQPAPMIVQKQDGAFLYATTDLATIEYRMEEWSPDAILYVVDHRQSLHFEQLFATARLWGYDDVELTHVSFGTVLGQDGRPYKTRSGDTVGLMGLLDEAVRRAYEIVSQNDDSKPSGPELAEAERQRIAEVVGIAALKYADLSQNRTSDYEFSYDKMLAMQGNTATYMQYAYARVRSIFRRGNVDIEQLRSRGAKLVLDTPAERALGLELLRLSEAFDQVVADYRPNQLTSYLFGLADKYSTFFEQCPVLKAETPELRDSRLLLCDLTARAIAKGLELLGIDVVEQM